MRHKRTGDKSVEKIADADTEEQKQIIASFFRVILQNFGKIGELFTGITDQRDEWKIIYPLEVLLFTGVMLFVCQLGSRRQINHRLRGNEAGQKKFRSLFGVEDIPHGDTLNYAYQRLEVEEVQEVVSRMAEKLMKSEYLAKWRLFGVYYLIAIDGTGVLSFKERHCPYCLTRKLRNGEINYYHPVLEAKWVTANGYAISLMTEFIENTEPEASKQDCELKAFYRLAERLKKRFGEIPFCLLLDGLFAGGPTLERCEKNNWKYMIVLSDDDLPSINQEFDALVTLPPESYRTVEMDKKVRQTYRWVNGIEYVDSEEKCHRLNVLECMESTPGKGEKETATKYKWLTNFTLLSTNSPTLANQAGRLRWKIENEGFNLQKRGGFCLEHAYSRHPTAYKIFYLLLQIALTFFQLMGKSPSFKQAFPNGVGSLKNMAYRLLEAWRNLRLDEGDFLSLLKLPLDTS
jgi:hypothetical protein